MTREARLSKAVALYAKISKVKRIYLAASLALLPALFLLDIFTGPEKIPPLEILAALAGGGGEATRLILWEVRLPVALAALLAGASLGLAGSIMQAILDNPLASPYTLGVAAGAAFGAALAYTLGVAVLPFGGYIVTLNAFAFAIATMALVYILGRLRGFTPEALILAGIAVGYAFHSLLALLEYMASEEALQAIVAWLFGSLYKATWGKLQLLTVLLLGSLVVVIPRAWRLTALRLGDEKAKSLGIEPGRERLIAFVIASLLTAVTVSMFGIIGFVGLVAPHTARLLVGEDERYRAALSLAHGSVMLLAADIASKSILPGGVIPIGIVTSLAGIPFLLALLAARRWEH